MVDKSKTTDAPFQDDPDAHALYNKMMETLRKADSLSYTSNYQWEAIGRERGECTYRAWLKKPNYFRIETEIASPKTDGIRRKGGILIGDGNALWIYWPQGRPKLWFEESEAYEKTRLLSYMTKATPLARHSIGHEFRLLAMTNMLILNPSTILGYTDCFQKHIDGVKSLGTEKVGSEDCDKIEVSIMKGQRSWYFWLSKQDHLPRKLREITRLSYDIVTNEEWSDVTLDVDISDKRFAWKPPEGWTQWKLPTMEEMLLKPGMKAPDFELASADGKRIRLSDYHGQVVWLCFWRVGCPPCRKELPYLQQIYSQHKDKGLVVLGFNDGDDKKITIDLLDDLSITFPCILDSSDAAEKVFQESYHGTGIPANYVIDRNGTIVDAWLGNQKDRAIATLQELGFQQGNAMRQSNAKGNEIE